MNHSRRISHLLLTAAFVWMALATGLAGCSPTNSGEEVHRSPDFYYPDSRISTTITADSSWMLTGSVLLKYGNHPLEEDPNSVEYVGCSRTQPWQVYDVVDWIPLATASIRLNGIPLVYNDEESILDSLWYTAGYAWFDLPPDSSLRFHPGDSLAWEFDVDGAIEMNRDYLWFPYNMPDEVYPELPGEGSHVSPGEVLTFQHPGDLVWSYFIQLKGRTDSGASGSLIGGDLSRYGPTLRLTVPENVVGDTLTLICAQRHDWKTWYSTSRNLLIDSTAR